MAKANTKALKSPALPWAIITIALSVAVGFAIGWQVNHNMNHAIDSKANHLAELKAEKMVAESKSQEQ